MHTEITHKVTATTTTGKKKKKKMLVQNVVETDEGRIESRIQITKS